MRRVYHYIVCKEPPSIRSSIQSIRIAHIERVSNESQWKSSLRSSIIILSNVDSILNRHFFYMVPKYKRLNSNAAELLNQLKVNTIFITFFVGFSKHCSKFFSITLLSSLETYLFVTEIFRKCC